MEEQKVTWWKFWTIDRFEAWQDKSMPGMKHDRRWQDMNIAEDGRLQAGGWDKIQAVLRIRTTFDRIRLRLKGPAPDLDP